jgi:hypothetical protein
MSRQEQENIEGNKKVLWESSDIEYDKILIGRIK